MQIPETLQQKLSAVRIKSAEIAHKAAAYTILFLPKAVMIGGGAFIGHGMATGDYFKILGGIGVAGFGYMADDSLTKAVYQNHGNEEVVVYRLDGEPQGIDSKF